VRGDVAAFGKPDEPPTYTKRAPNTHTHTIEIKLHMVTCSTSRFSNQTLPVGTSPFNLLIRSDYDEHFGLQKKFYNPLEQTLNLVQVIDAPIYHRSVDRSLPPSQKALALSQKKSFVRQLIIRI